MRLLTVIGLLVCSAAAIEPASANSISSADQTPFKNLEQRSIALQASMNNAERDIEKSITDNKRQTDALVDSARASGDLMTIMRATDLIRNASDAVGCLSSLEGVVADLHGDLHTLYFAISITSLMRTKFDQDTGLEYVRLQTDLTNAKLQLSRKTASDIALCGNSTDWGQPISDSTRALQDLINDADEQVLRLSARIGHSKYAGVQQP